jgi:hypothetical protein
MRLPAFKPNWKKNTIVYITSAGVLLFLLRSVVVYRFFFTHSSLSIPLILQWSSDFLAAVMLIAAGFFIFRNHDLGKKSFYFGSGLLLSSGSSSLLFYFLASFSLPLVVLITGILAPLSIIAVRNYDGMGNFFFLALGAMIHGSLNLLANSLSIWDFTGMVYTSLILSFALILFTFTFKKIVGFI